MLYVLGFLAICVGCFVAGMLVYRNNAKRFEDMYEQADSQVTYLRASLDLAEQKARKLSEEFNKLQDTLKL